MTLGSNSSLVIFLGVDSPFFSTIVLFKNQPCFLGVFFLPGVSGGFLEGRIPGKNGEGSPRIFAISELAERRAEHSNPCQV